MIKTVMIKMVYLSEQFPMVFYYEIVFSKKLSNALLKHSPKIIILCESLG